MSDQTLTRREKQRHTRKCLLEAAAKIFSQQGLEGTSVEQVAQSAGYTKGAFYANFKSKEELFLVMLDERFAEELDRLDELLAGTQEPLEEATAAATDFIRFTSGEWSRLYFQFVAHAAQDEDFRQELATRTKAMRARFTEVFVRWKEGFDKVAPIPQEDITAMLCFMADGFLVDRLVEPELPDQLYTKMIEVFLRGLEAMAEDVGGASPTAPLARPEAQ
jgi:AcrR family transcriptional regulator